jgi:hypothetical protein
MMLQYTCAARGGRTERVRRNRYAANQPKRVVYVSWKAAGYQRAVGIGADWNRRSGSSTRM